MSGSGLRICAILVYVPKMKPNMPNTIIAMSFHSTQHFCPNLLGQNVIISISGGNINANVLLLTAPTNEIIGPRFGIIAASTTNKQKYRVWHL